MQSGKTRHPFRLFSSIVVLGLLVGGLLVRQDLYDNWRIRTYSPSSSVEALVKDTTMTGSATDIFYSTHPQISDSQAFNKHCRTNEFSIVLGCYLGEGNEFLHRGDIYLYGVQDKRLDGVLQVTAAHEMLHAEYERLSPDEKNHIDALLNTQFKTVDDQRIKDTIEQYRKQDPSSVVNELHSILGTEVRNLNPELENYYKRYFSNRAAIVDYSEKYEQEFTSRKNVVIGYDARLDALKAEIAAKQKEIDSQTESLQSEQEALNSLRGSLDAGDYNARAAKYNTAVESYNVLVRQTRALIDTHNELVALRNSVATEIDQLVQALDSSPQTL